MSGIKWLQQQEHFDWMQKCLTCWKMSEEFISWSIKNGKYVSLINSCRDVAEMCSQCIKFEAQRSPFFQQLCEVCAEICERCAAEMEKYKSEKGIFTETLNSMKVFSIACREVAEKQKKEQVSVQGTAKQNDRQKS